MNIKLISVTIGWAVIAVVLSALGHAIFNIPFDITCGLYAAVVGGGLYYVDHTQ